MWPFKKKVVETMTDAPLSETPKLPEKKWKAKLTVVTYGKEFVSITDLIANQEDNPFNEFVEWYNDEQATAFDSFTFNSPNLTSSVIRQHVSGYHITKYLTTV